MTSYPEAQAEALWSRYKSFASKLTSSDDILAPEDEIEMGEGEAEAEAEGPAGGTKLPEEDDPDNLEVEIEVVDKRSEGGDASDPADWTGGPTPMLDVRIGGFDEGLAKRIADDVKKVSDTAPYIIFSKDFDKIAIYEVDKDKYRDAYLTRMEDATRSMTSVMQKDIERMMAARSQVVRVGGFKSGRLKGSALHRLRTSDDRVFDRKQENRSKDIAVSLLCDCSGSMQSGGKIMTAMTAAFALSQTLERVGIKHEVAGFTTTMFAYGHGLAGHPAAEEVTEAQRKLGRKYSRVEPIWFPIFKLEGERLTPDVKKRFADVPHNMALANNIDGEAVEIAANRLKSRKAGRHVLLVLSDGNPHAAGNVPQQEAHLKKTVKECTAMGIECIGIGIQDTSVRKYYPRNVVLNDINTLPGTVMSELRRILDA